MQPARVPESFDAVVPPPWVSVATGMGLRGLGRPHRTFSAPDCQETCTLSAHIPLARTDHMVLPSCKTRLSNAAFLCPGRKINMALSVVPYMAENWVDRRWEKGTDEYYLDVTAWMVAFPFSHFVFNTWSYNCHCKDCITSLGCSYNFLTHSPIPGQLFRIVLVLSPGTLQLYTVNTDYVKAPTSDGGVLLGSYEPNAEISQWNSHGSLSKGIFTVPEASLTALTPGSLPLN